MSTANDPGRDNAATGNNKNVAKDAIGMGFTYHTNDFVSKSPSTPSPFATGNASFAPLTGDGLWSGQLGAWSLKTAAITVPPGQTYARNGDLTGDRIIYDRLGRVRQVSSLVNSNGTWTSDGQGGWSAFYVYDQNSSQTRIQRWGKLDGFTSSLYDDATITTQSPTSNVVDAVVDAGTDVVAGYTDQRDQTPANTAVDAGHVRDFDIGLASPSLLDKAKALGIELRSKGTRTGPLKDDQLKALGLSDVASQISSIAGRKIEFMIYGTVEAATNRSPSILVPR